MPDFFISSPAEAISSLTDRYFNFQTARNILIIFGMPMFLDKILLSMILFNAISLYSAVYIS